MRFGQALASTAFATDVVGKRWCGPSGPSGALRAHPHRIVTTSVATATGEKRLKQTTVPRRSGERSSVFGWVESQDHREVISEGVRDEAYRTSATTENNWLASFDFLLEAKWTNT